MSKLYQITAMPWEQIKVLDVSSEFNPLSCEINSLSWVQNVSTD